MVPIGRKRRNKTLNPTQRQLARPRPRPLLAAGLLARRQPFAGTILRPEKKYLWLNEIRRECKIQTMERNIKMGQQLVTALPRSPFASPCLLRACPEVVSRGGKSLRVKKAIRLEEGTKRRGEQQKSRREVCEVCDDTVCPTRQPFRGGF